MDWAPKFLAQLRKYGVVRYACEAVNVGRRTVYERRQADTEFARQWQIALEESSDMLERAAIIRAAEGVKKPVYQGGELVGHVQEYSDTLLMFLLKARRPEKYRETFTIKHDVAKELSQKAREMGIDVATDPLLLELFAAAGVEDFGAAPDAAAVGAAGSPSVPGFDPADGGVAE